LIATTRRGGPVALMTCSYTCVHATSGLSAAGLVPSLARPAGKAERVAPSASTRRRRTRSWRQPRRWSKPGRHLPSSSRGYSDVDAGVAAYVRERQRFVSGGSAQTSLLIPRAATTATRRLSSGEGFGCPAAASRDTSTRLAPRDGGALSLPSHGGGVRRGDYALVSFLWVGDHRAVPAGDLDRVGSHPLCKLPLGIGRNHLIVLGDQIPRWQ
jgi:hypothetical protein